MKSVEYPQAGSVDCLGRKFHKLVGFSSTFGCTPISVGSRVRLLADEITLTRRPKLSAALDMQVQRQREHHGLEAIVLEFVASPRQINGLYKDAEGQDRVICRSVRLEDPTQELRLISWSTDWVQILELGTGVLPEGAYERTQSEIFSERYAALNHRHEGWDNLPTYLMATYLDNDARHQAGVLGLVHRDGTLLPMRLARYCREHRIEVDEASCYPEDFPRTSQYRYGINWEEIVEHLLGRIASLQVA